jgi:hypothetical protein
MKIIQIAFIIFLLPTFAHGIDMKVIEYERHEPHAPPEKINAELSVFVYDIPYFGACGVFPPYHIINDIFQEGGSQGGMSPGATWQPFLIERDEYDELVQTIKTLNPKTLGDKARYTLVKFEFDSNFDQITNWEKWIISVCEKHRESYLRKQSTN